MSFLTKHLPFKTLADLAEGRLSRDERQAAHLSACARCAAQLRQLEQTIQLMRTDDAEAAPREALAHVLNLCRARRASAEEPSRLRRVLASLSFDSAGLSPAFGVRSAQQSAPRQLLYSAGERDVDVRVARTEGDSWVVSGQVLGAPCGEGGRAELRGAGDDAVTASLNEQCEFTLPHVPAGTYTLRLSLGDDEVEVPGLELRA